MKLNNKENLNLSNMNTSDVAYLLLIFIIIISLICTDRIYGLHLPHSDSETRPENSAVRVVVGHNDDSTVYIIDEAAHSENELLQKLKMYDARDEFIIVADRAEPSRNIKKLIKILENNRIYKIAFMTD